MGMKLPRSLVAKLTGTPRPRAKRTPRPKPVAVLAPSSWVLFIPDYLPPSLNAMMGGHWRTKHKLKAECLELVTWYGRMIPKATSKRRVHLTLTRADKRHRRDEDSCWKSTLDALVRAGLLGDDNPDWCEVGGFMQTVGERVGTTVVLEEICDGD